MPVQTGLRNEEHVLPPGIALDRLIMGAFLGVSSVALIQFLSFETLDTALTLSLYCFAAAIPILAVGLYMIAVEEHHQRTLPGMAHFGIMRNIVELVGLWAAFTGLGGIFWHFDWRAAVLFVATSALAGAFGVCYQLLFPRR
jgi:hypothetical protein